MDIEVQEMVRSGATFRDIRAAFPMLRDDEIYQYLGDQSDDEDDVSDDKWFMGDEDDGQPTVYEEYQDYMDGDNWDYGQCDDGGF